MKKSVLKLFLTANVLLVIYLIVVFFKEKIFFSDYDDTKTAIRGTIEIFESDVL